MEEQYHSDEQNIFELEKENVAPTSDPSYQPSSEDDDNYDTDSVIDSDDDIQIEMPKMWENFKKHHPTAAETLQECPWMSLTTLDEIYDFALEASDLGWNVFGWLKCKNYNQ